MFSPPLHHALLAGSNRLCSLCGFGFDYQFVEEEFNHSGMKSLWVRVLGVVSGYFVSQSYEWWFVNPFTATTELRFFNAIRCHSIIFDKTTRSRLELSAACCLSLSTHCSTTTAKEVDPTDDFRLIWKESKERDRWDRETVGLLWMAGTAKDKKHRSF